jgi:UDP-N-acetylglucosamine:LPS N-acetylglucosamine transferase
MSATGRGRRVLVISGSVGAGHDGAANELAERLRAAGVAVDVRDYLDAVPTWMARLLRDGYTGTVGYVPAAFELFFKLLEKRGVAWRITSALVSLGQRTLQRWVTEHDYDTVISTYPLASQCLGELRERGTCPPPVMTYLTDPAAHVSWVHRGVDRHLTVTQATADQGRRDYGLSMVAVGPLVPERFTHPVPATEVNRLRRELGIPATARIALLVAGSLGLGDVVPTVEDVVSGGVVPVVLCGRSDKLRAQVAAVPGAVALGWRSDVHLLTRMADVLIHNAGGLSFTEAMVSGLPAITYRAIPGHGRANAAILDEAGLAPWARDREELWAAMDRQLAAGRRSVRLGDPADHILAMLAPAAVAA